MFKLIASVLAIGATVVDASQFKRDHSQEKRTQESARIRAKYPDRLPIIVEKAPKSDVPDIDKMKYLVPQELTVGQFVYVIRKRIHLPPEKAIFVFVNNVLPNTSQPLSAVFAEQQDEDGFLYVMYSGENTFGDGEELELDEEDWAAIMDELSAEIA